MTINDNNYIVISIEKKVKGVVVNFRDKPRNKCHDFLSQFLKFE